jgi:hypothetical protein
MTSIELMLLIANVGYELTGLGHLDAIGALLITWLAWNNPLIRRKG